MECERWLQARINDLRRRNTFDQSISINSLPEKLQKNFTAFNCNELNSRGESLILSVVKYEPDKVNQIRYISMLVRSGCDPSLPDPRQLRTPLMVACIENNKAVALHLISLKSNLVICDRLGNNALMYATMYCQAIVVKRLMIQLAALWAFEAYTQKNCSGLTAESIARKNDRILFAK
uniref:ANK_REP_REGION domain-containing protein n=1 Tax=Syphacia muris TaxID=451379 RepID=A0A0N5ALL2_9BILA